MRATILLLVACLAVASAQTTFTSLADAVRAANASAPNLSILLAAVQAAGVGSALTPNTTWTILAPDNAAFTSRLNESLGITPQQLLLPENRETLVQVLSYHVIPSAAVLSSQLTDGQNLTTALAGAAPLRVRIADGNVTFIGAATNATVIGADIRAGASVIHVIDDVLLPEAAESAPNVTAAQGPAAAAPAASPAAARSGASAAAAATGLLTVLLGAAVALLA